MAWMILSGVALCAGLVWFGVRWPTLPSQTSAAVQSLFELTKLVAAALIGILVTSVQKHFQQGKPRSHSIDQAQILLCMAGALMMVIINESLARAFGIAGAAGIIRFKTPVDDPKDATILFILLGLGMATGLGMFAVAGMGTMFLCVFLGLLRFIVEAKPRMLMLELVASSADFPFPHVQNVLNAYQIHFEPREVSHGKNATVKYQVTLPPECSLEFLSDQLMAGGDAGIQSVSWDEKKWMN